MAPGAAAKAPSEHGAALPWKLGGDCLFLLLVLPYPRTSRRIYPPVVDNGWRIDYRC